MTHKIFQLQTTIKENTFQLDGTIVIFIKEWSLTDWAFSDSYISIGRFQPISV